MGHIIDAARCTYLLQQQLIAADNIHCHYQFRPAALTSSDDYIEITSDESSVRANLLVAADGANSWVRQQAKIFAPQQDYNQLGIVATIESTQSHRDTAWQRFLNTGPIAVLPLAEGRSSIVWSVDTALGRELLAKSATDFAAAVQEALGQRLGDITIASTPVGFPLRSQQAERYYRHRLALVGDAAHSIHPLAGQGANLGFKDVSALVQQLTQVATVEWGDTSLLARYQRARQTDNQQTDLLMTTLHHVFRNESPMWQMLRGRGMNWVGATLPIKQLLARQAMGQD